MFMFAPGKSLFGLTGKTAMLSFTFRVRDGLKYGYVNTGIGNGGMRLGRGLGDNSRIRVVASGARAPGRS